MATIISNLLYISWSIIILFYTELSNASLNNGLLVRVSILTGSDLLVPGDVITLHMYVPSSPSIRYVNWILLVEVLPLEVVGLMVPLLSFVIVSPPGPIQLIITEVDSTPLTVLTVHWIIRGLPTIAPCMGPGSDMLNRGAVGNRKQ